MSIDSLIIPGRPVRTREIVDLGASGHVLSPGRALTTFELRRYSAELAGRLAADLAPIWAELADYTRQGLDHLVLDLRRRLVDIEREAALRGGDGLGILQWSGNVLLNEAWDGHAVELLMGTGSPTAFNNANARIGVGDSSTAASATQTDLQAASNKTYKAMDASYPAKGGATTRRIDWRATFASGDANYQWLEVIVDNGASALVTFFRNVPGGGLGTKVAGTSWQLTASVSFT